MSEPLLSSDQVIKLIGQVSSLATQVEHLVVTSREQGEEIKTLVALAERGRGSVWMLIGIGSAVGAFVTNFKAIAAFLLRG